MAASPGSAQLRPLSLLCRHRDLPPQVLLPSPGLWGARGSPGLPGSSAQRPRRHRDHGPSRSTLTETRRASPSGPHVRLSAPILRRFPRALPPPPPCRPAQLPSRGRRACSAHQASSTGGPSPATAREAQPGEPWAMVLHFANFVYNLFTKSPAPRTPGHCGGKGRGFEAGLRAGRGAAQQRPREPAPMRAGGGEGTGAASGSGSVFCGRCASAAADPPLPRPWSLPCKATRTPLWPPVATGPTQEKRLRVPASRAPQACESSFQNWRDANPPAERRAGRAAHAQNGLRCPRPGLARGGRTPRRRGAARGSALGLPAVPGAPPSPTSGAGGGPFLPGKGPRPREAARPGDGGLLRAGVLRALHPDPSTRSPCLGRGSHGSFLRDRRRPGLSFHVAQSAPVSGFARAPSARGGGGLRPEPAARGSTCSRDLFPLLCDVLTPSSPALTALPRGPRSSASQVSSLKWGSGH